MDFKKLSDFELETTLQQTVLEENKLKTQILHLLAEVERRRLYCKDYPSLFEYCTRTLKYSSAAAQRRIDTMRAMKLIPELETKILSGDLNLSSISQAQSFFRHEAKAGKAYSILEKKEVLQKLENKSSRDCIQTLIAISPHAVPCEKRRDLAPEKIELKVILDIDLVSKLDQIKAYLSHKNPGMTDAELLKSMAEICIEKLDPTKRKTKVLPTSMRNQKLKCTKQTCVNSKQVEIQNKHFCKNLTSNQLTQNLQKSLPSTEVKMHIKPKASTQQNYNKTNSKNNTSKTSPSYHSRYISPALKKQIYLRDNSCCTYLHPTTFERCRSRYFLEIDHIQPFALGGPTIFSNLRLLCRNHNQYMAIRNLGLDKILKSRA